MHYVNSRYRVYFDEASSAGLPRVGFGVDEVIAKVLAARTEALAGAMPPVDPCDRCT